MNRVSQTLSYVILWIKVGVSIRWSHSRFRLTLGRIILDMDLVKGKMYQTRSSLSQIILLFDITYF